MFLQFIGSAINRFCNYQVLKLTGFEIAPSVRVCNQGITISIQFNHLFYLWVLWWSTNKVTGGRCPAAVLDASKGCYNVLPINYRHQLILI